MRPPFGPRRAKGAPALSEKERVLAAWRGGVHLTPLEKMRQSTARSAASVLPGVLGDIRYEKRQSEAEIVRVWNHSIDPNIVAHAQPTGIRNGTLFVTVDSSVWLDEIVRYRRKEILKKLQTSFGADLIARISFRVG